jgi:hypothetical protein|tara:strand:- start:1944 stop:2507 length:564 start_codon:yes stop_codon:yes gene_type:complete
MNVTKIKKHGIFLKWWWFFCLLFAATALLINFQVHELLWQNDKTKLSFFILSIFYAMTFHCGYESWKLSQLANGDIKKLDNLDTRHEPGWFASDILLTLGLIGTVSGFILMLAGAFSGINIADVSSVQAALARMAVGMSTALYTTLTGLITSTILKFQYFRLDQDLERYRQRQASNLIEQVVEKQKD